MHDAKEDEENISNSDFLVIEERFHKVTHKLKNGIISDSESFCGEYEKLFFQLKNCVLDKRSQLYDHQQSYPDPMQKNDLLADVQRDAEKAWNLFGAGKKKEEAISVTVTQLKNDLAQLSSQLDIEKTTRSKQDEQFKVAIRDRNDFKLKLLESTDQLREAEKIVNDLKYRNESLEEKYKDLRSKNTTLLDNVSSAQKTGTLEKTHREHLEKDINILNIQLETKAEECLELQCSSAVTKGSVDKLKKTLHSTQSKLETQTSNCNDLKQTVTDLNETLEDQRTRMGKSNTELKDLKKQLEDMDAECSSVLSEKSRLQRKFDNEHKTVLKLKQNFDDAKSANGILMQEIQTLRRGMDKMAQNNSNVFREKSLLERETNLQTDRIHRIGQAMKDAQEHTLHQEQAISSLDKELMGAKGNIEYLEKKISNLDKNSEKQNMNVLAKQKDLERVNNEVNICEVEIQNAKREMVEWKSKLKKEEEISNRFRSEQGKTLRGLIDLKNENKKLKYNNSILTSEMKTLRNDLMAKEESIMKAHQRESREITAKEQLNGKLSMFKGQLVDSDSDILEKDVELQRLNASFKQMDEDVRQQRKDYDQLIHERDMLCAQLIRRNGELALVNEKMKIQSITLIKGETKYTERLEDVKQLKIKLQDIHRQLIARKNGKLNQPDLSKELVLREKELLQEKVKVRALSEELQNPLNVHRWRKLEGSDPAKFDLVMKNELLQKRIIQKSEEVM